MNISEIAKMAGVSSAAVSRYFNKGYISEEKRERIRKVVEETGYRPSLQAQTLRTRKTKLIGVILPKIDSSSMGGVVAGILSVLNESGYQMMLADTQNDPKKELEYLTVFSDKQVDGVILLATVLTAGHKKALKKLGIPVVVVGQKLEGYHCVYHDDYHAIYELTRMVLEKKRKKLGYIGVMKQDVAVGLERYRGYRDAVREAGLGHLADNYVISDFTIEGGYKKAGELLEQCPELDALLCATDEIAIGAMKYLKEQRIRIPEQMIVTGHGDSMLSSVTAPTLTTVHYFYEESGSMAAKMLLDDIGQKEEHKLGNVNEIKMDYFIVENESSGRE